MGKKIRRPFNFSAIIGVVVVLLCIAGAVFYVNCKEQTTPGYWHNRFTNQVHLTFPDTSVSGSFQGKEVLAGGRDLKFQYNYDEATSTGGQIDLNIAPANVPAWTNFDVLISHIFLSDQLKNDSLEVTFLSTEGKTLLKETLHLHAYWNTVEISLQGLDKTKLGTIEFLAQDTEFGTNQEVRIADSYLAQSSVYTGWLVWFESRGYDFLSSLKYLQVAWNGLLFQNAAWTNFGQNLWQSFLFLATTVMLVWSAYLINYRYFKAKRISDFIINLTILATSILVIELTILGALSWLTAPAAVVVNLALLSALLIWRYRKKLSVAVATGNDQGVLTWSLFLSKLWQNFKELRRYKILLLILCLVVTAYVVFVAHDLMVPEIGTDAITYQLTRGVNWIQNNGFGNDFTLLEYFAQAQYFPGNANLVFTHLMMFFHDDFLVSQGQLLFLILSAILTFSIGLRMGCRRRTAFLASLLLLAMPVMITEATRAQIDVIVMAVFLAGLYFLLSFHQTKNTSWLILFACAAGLLIGSKYTVITYAALLVPLFLYVLIKNRHSLKHPWRQLVFVSLIILALSGFWYARNIILTGNPVYPQAVAIAGHDIFPSGWAHNSYTSLFYGLTDKFSKLTNTNYPEYLGVQWWLILLCFIPFIYQAGKCLFVRRARNFINLYLYALPLIGLIIWAASPWSGTGVSGGPYRFIYFLFSLAYLTFLTLFEKGRWGRWLNVIITGISVVFFLEIITKYNRTVSLYVPVALIHVIILGLIMFAGLLIIFKISWPSGWLRNKWLTIGLALGLFIFLTLRLATFVDSYDANKYDWFYKYFYIGETMRWIGVETDHDNVAQVGFDGVLYLLYGPKFQNRVFNLRVNRSGNIPTHQYLDVNMNIWPELDTKKDPDFDTWLSNIKLNKIKYFFVWSPFTSNVEVAWLNEHPDLFTHLFNDGGMVDVYEYNQAGIGE